MPIKPRLMGGDEPRATPGIAWFVFKFVIRPGFAVVAALDDDFIAIRGHDGKQAVVVEAPEWGDPTVECH